jgi:hypothetical protein
MTMELSRLRQLIANGKIASVTFVKRSDGTERKMLCRTGVRKGLTGRGPNYDPESKNLLTVFDMEKKAYRTIPAENVVEITAQKRHFSFRS